MVIRQLSVFLENKQGRLAYVLNTLAENEVDISALSLADTEEFGILRLIVNDPEKGRQVLTDAGLVVRITDMVVVVVDDAPGGAAGAITLLSDNHISIEYMYACISRIDGKALTVMRVDDIPRAEALLAQYGLTAQRPEEVYRI